VRDKFASRTALSAAYLRAAHQILDAGPLILNDPVSFIFIDPDAEKRIQDDTNKYMRPEAKALRSHVVLRSRYAKE
jgi:hypothetical protein